MLISVELYYNQFMYLRDTILPSKIVLPTDSGILLNPPHDTCWMPYHCTNDFYPKFVIQASEEEILPTNLTVYRQKNEFKEVILPETAILIEPTVSGLGVSFENIYVFWKGKKYVIHYEVKPKEGVTWDDSFYRFNSMYTFDESPVAADEKRREYTVKSWSY